MREVGSVCEECVKKNGGALGGAFQGPVSRSVVYQVAAGIAATDYKLGLDGKTVF